MGARFWLRFSPFLLLAIAELAFNLATDGTFRRVSVLTCGALQMVLIAIMFVVNDRNIRKGRQ